jgi:hypothetical protein
VPVVPFGENGIVVITAAEQYEVVWSGVLFIELQIAIDSDFGGVDAGGFCQIAPNQDRGGAPFIEWSRGIVH